MWHAAVPSETSPRRSNVNAKLVGDRGVGAQHARRERRGREPARNSGHVLAGRDNTLL